MESNAVFPLDRECAERFHRHESIHYVTDGNVGIGTTSPDRKVVIKGGHEDTTFKMYSTGDGGLQDAHLSLWASEPGLTYTGAGMGNNINGSAYYGRISTDRGASYIRLMDNEIRFNTITSSGIDTNVMHLANGNVGIGTISPQSKLHVTGDVRVDGNIAAKYQDIAEWVPASESLEAGMVVIIDPDQANHVMASSGPYDTRVAGIISSAPGIILGEGGDNRVRVATTGRVKAKVDATHSPIQIGDLLVTSANAGMAMKSERVDIGGLKIHRPGTLIGKALEPLKAGEGEILILLSLQ